MLARLRQTLATALSRRNKFGPMRRSDRPAALVIRGQAAGDLASLDREVEDVRRDLKAMDYDVLVVSDGTKKAFDSILSTDFRSRLVILHYAGHATNDGFIIEDGRGGTWLLKASDFARLFGVAANLRLIFLNGCWSFSQLKTYESELKAVRNGSIDCCVISSLDEIGDDLAADFAASVYKSLADNATLADATRNVANFVISRDYGDDAVASVKVISNGQDDFRLSDGWPLIFTDLYKNGRKIEFNPLLVYVVVLSLIGMASAFLAHGPQSSPAFQAAFSIPPDDTIEAFVKTHGEGEESLRALLPYLQAAGRSPEALVHFGETCIAGPPPGAKEVENPQVRRRIAAAINFDVRYGWMVEGGRILLLAALLLVVISVAQQTKFPRSVPLLSKGEFAAFVRFPIGAAFLVIGLLGSAYIVHYHLVTAPARLANFDPENDDKSWQEKRWALVHCIPEAWKHADGWNKKSFFDDFVKPDQPGTGQVWSSFVEKQDSGTNGNIYFRMYRLPYHVYLPYSLTTFVGLLLPSLYIMFLTGLQSYQWCRMAAAGVRVQLRDWARNRERIETLARQLERRSKEATRIFAAIMFMFSIAALYEAYLGKNTIAMMARTSTVIAIVLVIIGAGLGAALLAGLAQLKQAVRDDVEDSDAKFSEQICGYMSVAIHPILWLVVAATGAAIFRLVQLLFS